MPEFKTWNLDQFKDWIDLCLHCGACYARGPIVPHNWRELPPHEYAAPHKKCPPFEYFKFKNYSPQGRQILASLIFNDRYEIDEEVIQSFFSCTSCAMCNEICIPYQPLYTVLAMRQEIVEKGLEIPNPLKKITDNIQSSGNIFGSKKHPKIFKDLSIPETGEDIFYSGCYATYLQPETALASVKILKSAGVNIAHLGDKEGCCGEMLKQSGNMNLFKKKAVENVEKLKQAGAKRVIISCAHGYSTFKNDYTNPHVVGELPFEVIHITEIIASLLKNGRIRFSKNLNKTVTYHDPCFLGRQCGVYTQPREILEAIPGLTLKEMDRYGKWSYCCGAGGKVTLNAFPEMAKETGKERLLEAKAVADTLVTSCPTCLAHLKKTAKTEGIDIEIVDLSMLVAATMEQSD